MRKHLYKAKIKGEQGVWVQGSLVVGEFGKYPEYTPHYIVPIGDLETKIEVRPETVCEFSGIYDIDNQPIFEGDNIEIRDCGTHTVEFINSADFLGLNFKSLEAPPLTDANVIEFEMKVVGNIHDIKPVRKQLGGKSNGK